MSGHQEIASGWPPYSRGTLSWALATLYPSFLGLHLWLSGKGAHQQSQRLTLMVTLIRILDTYFTHQKKVPKATCEERVDIEERA